MSGNRTPGFTIVELIIVIVVIAILAAISVVAYNGIQGRAQQASNQTAIRNYVQAFKLMKADTGTLPAGVGPDASCLGPTPLPNPCALAGQFTSAASSSATKTLLEQYGLTNPLGLKGSFTHFVYTSAYYGEPALLWQLPPTQDCTNAPGRFNTYPAWADNVRYSARSATATECTMSLRDI